MDYPYKIRITAKVSYEVLFVTGFDDDTQMGECRKESRQILIKTGLGQQETLKTVAHELLHAVEFEYKLKIPHQVIYDLEQPIESLLRLNKWIPKSLIKKP